MTGYGVGAAHSAKSSFEISIRSVNGRFLETRFHLPKEIFALESEFQKLIEKHFHRGTVDVFVSIKANPAHKNIDFAINYKLAESLVSELKKLSQKLKINDEVKLESLLKVPEIVFKKDSHSGLSSSDRKALLTAFEKACKACNTERAREGKSIFSDLMKLLHQLKSLVDDIQSVREEANVLLMERFKERIKSKLEGMEIDSSRLSQEVVIQLEKSDINEELARLREHTANYLKMVQSSGAQGKKLDFYTQELLREVNTIGSKSSLAKLTQKVVEAKTLVEQLREQVQNIE